MWYKRKYLFFLNNKTKSARKLKFVNFYKMYFPLTYNPEISSGSLDVGIRLALNGFFYSFFLKINVKHHKSSHNKLSLKNFPLRHLHKKRDVSVVAILNYLLSHRTQCCKMPLSPPLCHKTDRVKFTVQMNYFAEYMY